ncbi:MAG: outer membrane lipoprotein-sorting protein [Myxococcota bacterium]|jgi:hypothetical protein|nr:outer membrane lipoprotein-sorting protein [Myxococcota bacterium]
MSLHVSLHVKWWERKPRPRCALLSAVFAAVFSLVLVRPAGVSAAPDETPAARIEAAFDRLFDYPSVRTVELRIKRGGRTAGRREFDFARQLVDGRAHTIMRFTGPSYLRGNGILMIEGARGVSHTWFYQPEIDAPRRISTYQKEDAFFGSDLSYADLETRSWIDYEVTQLPASVCGPGGACETTDDAGVASTHAASAPRFDRFEARPLEGGIYARHVIVIERSTGALARLESYRAGDPKPAKVLEVDLASLEGAGEVLIPRKMTVTRRDGEWVTEVAFPRVEIKPEIAESAFSAMRLRRGGTSDLFKLVDRLSARAAKKRGAGVGRRPAKSGDRVEVSAR